MINWLKKLFGYKSLRERGKEYAIRQLQKGVSPKALRRLADDPFNFNDFDRGILDVVRTMPEGEE